MICLKIHTSDRGGSVSWCFQVREHWTQALVLPLISCMIFKAHNLIELILRSCSLKEMRIVTVVNGIPYIK